MKINREDIVQAAVELFRDRGYAGTSMRDIADAVGLTKASLYSRFADKEELAIEALAATMFALKEIPTESDEWVINFRSILTHVGNHLRKSHRCIGLHFAYGMIGEETKGYVQAFFDNLNTMFLDVFERGGLTGEAAEALTEDIIGDLEGATLWIVLYNNPKPLDRVIAKYCEKISSLADLQESEEARSILRRYTPAELAGSPAELKLAKELYSLEAELLRVRAALAGQAEAESCFL